MLAIGPAGDDISDEALVQMSDGLFQRLVVPRHQAAGDFEIFLFGLLSGLEHPANAR
ncbi:MAG: hypothetical protein IIB56_11845 [Planctomycetes bacterium]|nr:hypothetical protein [Planctomycetota bacterium]